MVDFTAKNVAPVHRGPTHNFTVEAWFAPKAAGLTIASTSGFHSPGAVDSGSYNATQPTSMNMTKLGATKFTQDHHINEQGANMTFGVKEITPFGIELAGKTSAVVPSVYSYLTTTEFTVDTGGGGVSSITLASSTGISGYTGKRVSVEIGTGESAYNAYPKIESISGDVLTFEDPLDEAPADGASVYFVDTLVFRKGGSRVKKWTAMFNMTGDFEDRIIHYSLENVITDGGQTYPDADVGMTNFTLDSVPQRETIDGLIQPVVLKEYLKFA